MLKLPKLDLMKQCGLAVFGLGALLMICGWFIAFVSLCYGQSESYFDRFDYSHSAWFIIWIQLFLCFAIFGHFFLPFPTDFMVSVFLGACFAITLIVSDAHLYADSRMNLLEVEANNDRGSMTALTTGFLILALGNLFALCYFAVKFDLEHRPNKQIDDSFGGIKGSGISGPGGIIGSFPGSGLRQRAGFQGENPVDSVGVNSTSYPPQAANSMAPRSPDLGTPNALGSDPLSNGYSRPNNVEIGMPTTGSAVNATSTETPFVQAPRQDASLPLNETAKDDNLAPPILSSNLGPSTAGAAGGAAAGGAVPAAAAGASGTQSALQRAEALYSYKASEDDPTEISFAKGDVLQIVDSSGKWWQAQRSNGELGIVPSNYLRLI